MPERMAAREQQVLDGMNQGLDAIGAPRVASIGALYNEADIRELYTYPELDDYGPRDNVKYLGNFQPGMGAEPQWPAASGKRIFAYLEAFKQVDTILNALAATGQPVLAYLPHAPPELLQTIRRQQPALTDKPLDLLKTAAALRSRREPWRPQHRRHLPCRGQAAAHGALGIHGTGNGQKIAAWAQAWRADCDPRN